MSETPILETHIANYPLFRSGKVRESYDLGDRLLIIATDRISAFDQVMPTGIPGKGQVLNQLSAFWFDNTRSIVENHYCSADLDALPDLLPAECARYAGRSMIVEKARRIDIECVVRGHIAGSAWTEYLTHGTVAGISQQRGMLESEKLVQPVFTPAIKNESGHDQNISIIRLREIIGSDLADRLEQHSLDLYAYAYNFARERGVIIADTKFEFGFTGDRLIVIDEMLTPDSSRFWDAATFAPGAGQPSLDKQYLRDWLISTGWDREPPAPLLPGEVVSGTVSRYLEAFERLTGKAFNITRDDDQELAYRHSVRVSVT
ncbi:phosphoribosylaminoimidazolesuccinocarboxamide synthase [soil metagenome]